MPVEHKNGLVPDAPIELGEPERRALGTGMRRE
jgi:hypothetical protein